MNEPTVSIILPTYNRARFLPRALASIRAQTLHDWELIIIDDGSTDGTRELVQRLVEQIAQPVRYLYQTNQGAYGARNTGLDHVHGKYVAFFDSDDEWLAHHLERCVDGLELSPEIDWIYGACRIVEEASGAELAPSTFYVNCKPRPFMRLRTRVCGDGLRIIDDRNATRCMILNGLFCGLQNSVIRRSFFRRERFEAATRNEAEDQLIVMRALASGHRFAYFDDIHVIYNVHEANSSASATACDWTKLARLRRLQIQGFERLAATAALSPMERRALRKRLASAYFWQLGYAVLWMNAQRGEAIEAFRKGLTLWPLSLRCWKTYALATLRHAMARGK